MASDLAASGWSSSGDSRQGVTAGVRDEAAALPARRRRSGYARIRLPSGSFRITTFAERYGLPTLAPCTNRHPGKTGALRNTSPTFRANPREAAKPCPRLREQNRQECALHSEPRPGSLQELRMSLLIFAIIVLVVAALIASAVQRLPLPSPFGSIIQALILIAAAVIIAQRAGLF